jgi:hypothetical protein
VPGICVALQKSRKPGIARDRRLLAGISASAGTVATEITPLFKILRAISPREIRVALYVLKCLCCCCCCCWLLAALTDHTICADVQQTLHSTYSTFGESLGPLLERQRGSYPSVSEDAEWNSRHPSVSEEAELNSRPSSHSPPSLEVLGPQPLYSYAMLSECWKVF